MIRKITKKIKCYLYSKTNQAKLIRFLEINAVDPCAIHLYGRVDFGSEPWIISLGKNVYITDGVKFITHDGGTLIFRQFIPDLEITKPICLGDNVYVGNNVIFLPGVSVGNNVVIGAGAVITKNIPDGEVWAGVPARKIRSSEEYFNKLKEESIHLGHLPGEQKDVELRKYYGRI